MIFNGSRLLAMAPIEDMIPDKRHSHGVSYGLAEAGADIRVKQDIRFYPPDPLNCFQAWEGLRDVSNFISERDRYGRLHKEMTFSFNGYTEVNELITPGRFCLASSVERFKMPSNVVAVVGHKSTWARRGVNVWAGTTAEPGWEGWLTLEIGFTGLEPVHIPAGSGIAQVLFHQLSEPGDYADGKYARQPDRPVDAIMEKG